ncbi:MAG: AtpZ/AtpI family protein [Planctomycetaceae bacterium]|nr:AtpZ/AtpI family protein [Planctomycetaceae bacterium]
MSDESGDESFRSLMFQWSARASVIAIGMVIPTIIGVGLDRLFGTVVLFAVIGVIIGMASGFWQLIRIASK